MVFRLLLAQQVTPTKIRKFVKESIIYIDDSWVQSAIFNEFPFHIRFAQVFVAP